jgi:D-proline reductase (dithiol) PrdB
VSIVPRLQDLGEIERQAILNFPFFEHDTAPVTILGKPLAQARVALVTSAGIHIRGDRPFAAGDQTWRMIPGRTPAGDIIQSHTSIGFDRIPMYRDINICFPIDRLRELAERGTIGTVGDRFFSFMGAQRNPRRIVDETGPEVARELKADNVDAVILTPT